MPLDVGLRRGLARLVARREPGQTTLGPGERLVEGGCGDRLAFQCLAAGADLGPQVLDDPFRLQAGGSHRVVALLPGAAAFLLGDAQCLGRAQLGGPGAIERLAGLALGRLDRRQRRLERALRLGQA